MEDEQLSPTPKVLGAMAITHSEMERRLRSRKASEKEPLPGERRGTSGAGAGRDSMRATGGRTLNRRAPTGSPEQTTAESQRSNPQSVASPADSVLLEQLLATTKAGKVRQRMKWTSNLNEYIMRVYYRATRLETEMTGYRQSLHAEFREKFPHIVVTEQRLVDQKRAILTNNLIPKVRLEQIKQEVAEEISSSNNGCPLTQTIADSHVVPNSTQLDEADQDPSTAGAKEDNLSDIIDIYQELFLKYSGLDPTLRPRIPKLNINRKDRLTQIIQYINEHVLPFQIKEEDTLTDIHAIVYCAAATVAVKAGFKLKDQSESQKRPSNKNYTKPPWQQRLENQIQYLRREIGRVTQYLNQPNNKKLAKKIKKTLAKIRKHGNQEHELRKHKDQGDKIVDPNLIAEHLDELKQKLAAKSRRLRRYKETTERKLQNSMFRQNEKVFYQQLRPNCNFQRENNGAPDQQNLEQYWSDIWSETHHHNSEAHWIKEEINNVQTLEPMLYQEITVKDVSTAIAKTHNWKAPGPEHVQNFWYKQFTSLHHKLAQCFTQVINSPEDMPLFLTKGITYMKPKSRDTQNPSQYRPITCLPTMYKILTSCITSKIQDYIEDREIMTEQQKGCRRLHKGCKEQLLTDMVILQQAHKNHRNLHMAYIDYKKAFDSVPHSWLIEVLRIYKINETIINFLEQIMTHWRTTLSLRQQDFTITTKDIRIKRGIFQGDSLSPLLFCLALNPLSTQLNSTHYGFKIRKNKKTIHTISHLMYMDDIKLYSSTDRQLQYLLEITRTFSEDIHMSFGIDKCKTLHVDKTGKLQKIDNSLSDQMTIQAMNDEEMYKYLGFDQAAITDNKAIKQSLTKLYKSRITALLKTKLTGKNMIKAINTFAVPVYTYSFGIIPWSDTDLEDIQRLTRTILTKFRHHHPNSAIERVTLPRNEGGRGLIDLKNLCYKQIHSLRNFYYEKQATSELHAAIVQADTKLTPLDLNNKQLDISSQFADNNHKIDMWSRKELHGRHANDLKQPHVDSKASNAWLKYGDLFGETEGFMVAIQDQVINTKSYRKHILKQAIDDKCRKCHTTVESIQHITSGCKLMAHTDYTYRHNQVANIIHQKLAAKSKLQETTCPYYKYVPDSVLESSNYKLYYDREIITDKTIHHNRPDITFVDKRQKIGYLIDITIPQTANLQTAHAEKITKYTELAAEVKALWHLQKVHIIPLVISCTGVVPNNIHKNLELIQMPKYTFKMMQKSIILNTCRIVRKFLNYDET